MVKVLGIQKIVKIFEFWNYLPSSPNSKPWYSLRARSLATYLTRTAPDKSVDKRKDE
jgi:hypothetical protein